MSSREGQKPPVMQHESCADMSITTRLEAMDMG